MGILAIIGACVALLVGFVFTAFGHPYWGVAGYIISLMFFLTDIFLLNSTAGVRGGHTLFVAILVGISAFMGYLIDDNPKNAVLLTPIYSLVTWTLLEGVRRRTAKRDH